MLKTLSVKIAWTYLWIRTCSISCRLQVHLMPAYNIHLNDLLPKCVLVTSYLNNDQFAGSYRLRCALLWSGLAVAVPAAVVGQVNASTLHVTASHTAKPAIGINALISKAKIINLSTSLQNIFQDHPRHPDHRSVRVV